MQEREILEPLQISFGQVFVSEFDSSTYLIIDVENGKHFGACPIDDLNIGLMGTMGRKDIAKFTGKILSETEVLNGIKNSIGTISTRMTKLIHKCSRKQPRMIG